jgi:crotonobetaine/carnitine-CoA ligase
MTAATPADHPFAGATLTEMFLQGEMRGDRLAYAFVPDDHGSPPSTLSYAQLVGRARRIATGFVASGISRGERLAIVALPRPEFVTGVAAAILSGAAAAPVNHLFRRRELVAYLRLIAPAAVLVDESTVAAVLDAIGDLPRRPLLIGTCAGLGADLDLDELGRLPPIEPVAVSREDPAVILHTSGTTGLPKAVVRTHGAYAEWVTRWAGDWLVDDDRALSFIPLYHQAGLVVGWLASFGRGIPFFQQERFRVERFWDVVVENGITWPLGLLEPSPALLLDQPPSPLDRAHSVRWILAGSALDVVRRFEERFGCAMHTGYGSTETTLVTMPCTPAEVSRPLDPSAVSPRAMRSPAGWALAGFSEFRVVREDGTETDADEVGALQVRGRAVFGEYFGDPVATAGAFTDDGWFVPGDAAFRDGSGCLHVIGRSSEMIRRSGENIAAREIEIVLEEHPDVLEAAVVGVPDETRGSEVLACLVRRPGSSLSADDVFEHCRRQLAVFKVPRFLDFRHELPKTPTFKIQKNRLLETGDPSQWTDRYRTKG